MGKHRLDFAHVSLEKEIMGYQQGALCPSGLCGASPECVFSSCLQLWFLIPKPSLPGLLFSPLTAHCSEITPHGVEQFKDNRGTRLIIPPLFLPSAQMAKVSLLLKNKIKHRATHTRKALARETDTKQRKKKGLGCKLQISTINHSAVKKCTCVGTCTLLAGLKKPPEYNLQGSLDK